MNNIVDTKQKILNISMDLFSKQGYSGTSIRQIAKKVGIRESGIYNHFKGKKSILEELFEIYGGYTISQFSQENLDLDKVQQNPYEFLTNDLLKCIVKVICNDRANQFSKLIIMEYLCGKDIQGTIEKKVIFEIKKILEVIFIGLENSGQIKNVDIDIMEEEFIAPLILIYFRRLAHLESKDSVETEVFIEKLVKSHIIFFWNSIVLDS